MSTSDDHLVGTGAVADLEHKLRDLYGARYALCVSSATTGLLAVAFALGLRRSEFLTTPYTYGATLGGWLLLENRPVFADIDRETLTLDPRSACRLLTPRTKAVLSSDIFGTPCDSLALRKLADEHGLWYVADAAQSFGARRDCLPASSLADAVVLSFTSGKLLDAGEGGAIITDHSDLYDKLIWWTQHPYRQHRDLGLNTDNEFGLNGRMHPCAALHANTAFAESLQKLKVRRERCRKILDILNMSKLAEPISYGRRNIEPSFFRLTAAWKAAPCPEKLRPLLRNQGIEAEVLPVPVRLIYDQPAFLAQYGREVRSTPRCPVAEGQAAKRFAVRTSGTL
jgi:dTDP-4-amino-4,6-dideoxygalactose transaminase